MLDNILTVLCVMHRKKRENNSMRSSGTSRTLDSTSPECDAFLFRCIYGSDFSNQGEGILQSLFSSNIRTTSIFRVLFLCRQCLALAALERVHTSLAEV